MSDMGMFRQLTGQFNDLGCWASSQHCVPGERPLFQAKADRSRHEVPKWGLPHKKNLE